ncbi:type II toxin-antitoxin system VapC family toxin [Saccharomonospora halophila]|uniref:type II toxin-antitoxin system VapC family toxin n=1 Tax=Saccharomonospora halophila TaxID=129922 RepID=UPI0018DDFEEE|nr:type II toxin-antitoxin system VapC family toxin [Saccharomonospora halophila]
MARQENHTLFVSVVTIMELELGGALKERRDPEQGARLRRWLTERVIAAFADRIVAVDLPVAQQAAALPVPDHRPERDAPIAATARTHGMTVVTRNGRDFTPTGVDVLDPWEWSQEP